MINHAALARLPEDLLRQVAMVSVSTTLATNAIVEGKGQKVGLLLLPPDHVDEAEAMVHHRPVRVVREDPAEIHLVLEQLITRTLTVTLNIQGQPALGYYDPSDPWVLRRQIALLHHAGVDVLIFDYSNAVTYDTQLYALCGMIEQMRLEGCKINLKIAFLTHANSGTTATYLYNTLYGPGN